MCPGKDLDHLCLCLFHIPCGFMCRHINMEQQRFIDKFLAAGRSRSNNQKTDFQSKTFLSSSWPKIWTLWSYYIFIYAHEYVHVWNVHEVTYMHVMPVHLVWFSCRMCIFARLGIQLNATSCACNSSQVQFTEGWKHICEDQSGWGLTENRTQFIDGFSVSGLHSNWISSAAECHFLKRGALTVICACFESVWGTGLI